MRYIAIVTLEGVLSMTDNLKSSQPTPWAKQMYQGLRHEYRTVILTKAEDEEARWWLAKEFIGDFALLNSYVAFMSYPDWRIDQVRQFLADGYEISLMYDTDDYVIHGVNQLGIPGMRVSPPLQRTGWRDHTTEVQPWESVVGYSG